MKLLLRRTLVRSEFIELLLKRRQMAKESAEEK